MAGLAVLATLAAIFVLLGVTYWAFQLAKETKIEIDAEGDTGELILESFEFGFGCSNLFGFVLAIILFF